MGLVQVPPVPVVLNVAVTLRAAVIESTHPPVPLHAPLQPANAEPLLAAALSVTDVPLAKFEVHALPQLIPPGDEVTVPAPEPIFVTLSGNDVAVLLNVAVTERATVIETMHAPVPVQAPLHPAKVEPLAAEAVRDTDVPLV